MNKQIYWKILLSLFLLGIALAVSVVANFLSRVDDQKISFITPWGIEPSDTGSASQVLPGGVVVTKVIDGDTIVVEGGITVRLLGIDSDEKGYPCYSAAKERLEQLVLGKVVSLEASKADLDQYGRSLRYVFLGSQNTSVLLVSEGLAVARFFPDNEIYREEITRAENEAKTAKRGCKWDQRSQTKLK